MRSGQTESIRDVILVLGKRLVCNTLTEEGRSRVEALPEYLRHFDMKTTALVFCGGITDGQTQSEARSMLEYFSVVAPDWLSRPAMLLLEERSTNTIENFTYVARILIKKAIPGPISVSLVSNDYHLERMFQIQTLLNEQGLLSAFKTQCRQAGLEVSISDVPKCHRFVPYPHRNISGDCFLALDELTVYRVFLQGVVRGVFKRPVEQVYVEPYRIANCALARLMRLTVEPRLRNELSRLQCLVHRMNGGSDIHLVNELLPEFHTTLTALNRQFDPESSQHA